MFKAYIQQLLICLCLVLVPFFGTAQPAEKACFSVPGGFYEEPFQLELFPFYANHHIRFTINGNQPTAQSTLYTEPLTLDERLYSTSDIFTVAVSLDHEMFYPDSVGHCIVIRAAVFDAQENRLSEVATNSYFIRSLGCDTHGLPAISLCADSLDLFSFYRGIMVPGAWWSSAIPEWTGNYFCKGMEWERPCNVEFYEADNTGINQQAGLRTHGGASRRLQQKGLKLYAREEYGKKRFEHPFFEEIPQASFKHLSLKPFRCSHWMTTGLQDPLAHRIARNLDLDVLAARQAVLFLNGEYYGIYAVEEVPDERYLEDHYGIDPDSVNIIKKWNQLDCGDSTHWHDLYYWVKENDLSMAENYERIQSLIDMDNFIDYLVFELCSANNDWPANNVRCWQEGDGPWRWFFYDGDGCFFKDWDVFANVTDTSNHINPSNAQSTLLFRKLFENEDFMQRFSTRFHQLTSTTLQYAETFPYLDQQQALIREEVPQQCQRFAFLPDMEKWEADLAHVDDYLRNLQENLDNKLSCFMSVYNHQIPESPLLCYPNPFHDRLNLQINTSLPDNSEVRLCNAWGQMVYRQKATLAPGINRISMDLHLPAGVYFLWVDQYVTKIVCQ